jgi:hypothetical protein
VFWLEAAIKDKINISPGFYSGFVFQHKTIIEPYREEKSEVRCESDD